MIEVKQAVEQAITYLRNLPVTADSSPAQVTLEEVELTEDDRYWLITLSYRDQNAYSVLSPPKYKIFKIDAANGRVLSMKIRDVARP